MSVDPLSSISLLATPQREQADPRQVRNNAGGFTFTVDPVTRLRRFLIMGTSGGTFYAGQRELTRENADAVFDLARTDGETVVRELVAISTGGRAPKNDQAIFALAAVLALGSNEAKQAAVEAVPLVCRTGTHLFQLVQYATQFRGWGRALRRAVSRWFQEKDADQLAYQAVKYRERKGWTQRDVLRSAHPAMGDPAGTSQKRAVLDFVCGRDLGDRERPRIVDGFLVAQAAATPWMTAQAVREYRLSWEMLRTEHLNDPDVWRALLDNGLPMTALIRQLPRLTRLGLFTPGSPYLSKVVQQLTSEEALRKARVHPITMLVALKTYARGVSEQGTSTWTPVRPVVDALDMGFYASFGTVEPTGKRRRIAIDISGSMSHAASGLPLSCIEGAMAMAMASVASEPSADVVGFTAPVGFRPQQRRGGWGYSMGSGIGGQFGGGSPTLTPLDVSPRRRLDDNIRSLENLQMGGTDVALPMLDALKRGLEFDSFEVWTDNETWSGDVHAHQALVEYRKRTGIDARLVVVAMTSARWTVADPSDAGMLDVEGFDSAVPQLIGSFIRGEL